MKCQSCDEAATSHVTEIVAGKAVEYHAARFRNRKRRTEK
jgi:hypothetical protein